MSAQQIQTIAVTDYSVINPTLAKVIVAYTGMVTKAEMAEAIAQDFSEKAVPVLSSFRSIGKNSAVGFLRANKEIRVLGDDPKEVQAARKQYRVLGSNIMMDNADKSLWEIRSGPGGKFLARHGQEDLAELVEANTNHRRQDVPKLSRLTMARAAKGEFAAFVTPDGVMDYGFVLRANSQKCEVLSQAIRTTKVVPMELVASLHQVNIARDVHQMVVAALTKEQQKTEADYWRTLFSYAPDYAEQMVRYVEEDAAI